MISHMIKNFLLFVPLYCKNEHNFITVLCQSCLTKWSFSFNDNEEKNIDNESWYIKWKRIK